MSKFTLINEENGRTTQVEFDLVCLDDILDEITIFLKASGYTYLEELVAVNTTAEPKTYTHDDDEAVGD